MPDFPSNIPAPVTTAQLSQQLWQVPPSTPVQPPAGSTLSGGVSPAPVQPGSPPQAAPPVAPASGYPTQQPQYPQPPQQPQYQQPQIQQPAPQQPVGPSREYINELIASGQVSASDVAGFQSDRQFLEAMWQELVSSAPPAAQQQPVAPTAPQPAAVQQIPPANTPQPMAPANDDFARSLLALQQSGAIEFANGRYVSKYPDFQSVAERANVDQMRAQQSLQELANPGQWIEKNAAPVFDKVVAPLREEIARLQHQIQASLPKPHEAWLQKNEPLLRVKDSSGADRGLTPAGQIYDRVYRSARQRGVTDLQALHDIASQAAETMFSLAPPAAPAAPLETPMTYAQGAAAYQPQNPGFNLPGTELSRHQQSRSSVPVTNQGTVDFHGIAAGIVNGSIPR